MIGPRVIPVLQIDSEGWLVKTTGYRSPRYLGDPINAVKIFNEKQVDELIIVDIDATRSGAEPAYALIEEIASEAFMPVAYGGGIQTLDQARRTISLGVEKVVMNTALFTAPEVVATIAAELGSQSVVASLDVRRDRSGILRTVYASATKESEESPEDAASRAVQLGVGEIVVSSIDREGSGIGYDLDAITRIASGVSVPVVSLGGAANVADFEMALSAGASAVAAGSRFVFFGRWNAVLITYPNPGEIALRT